ncbi:MAG: TDE2712 family protein [Treponema sp.]
MLKEISVNQDVLEMMLFYWESVASKDKMSDEYFLELAGKKEMQSLYSDSFTKDSFRRVLSAISNREKLNSQSPKESKFWNQNMRMIEDLTLTHAMIAPVKKLNLSNLIGENLNTEKLEVFFIPLPEGDFFADKNTIAFNFFSILASYNGNDFENLSDITVSLHGKDVKDYVVETIKTQYKS